ncbi:hypothetical protein K1W54_04660 [Micromonospora sp. CPCC 205371]|nr:hypothetical protein [Micromonospora sp. CPCC 205371]
MTGIARRAPWEWFKANDLPSGIPDDAELHVDEEAGTITVEVFAEDSEGRRMFHASVGLMTRLATFPLKVAPPPGLVDAYQRTVDRVRWERDAATAIRYETAQTLIRELNLDPIKVFNALRLPVPTHRMELE